MYFKEGRAKVLMGLCRGKKTYDKRESLKKRSAQRDILFGGWLLIDMSKAFGLHQKVRMGSNGI